MNNRIMSGKITIHFLGAAGTVTGSKYLIQCQVKNILVDCGLFQGLKKLRLLNWADLPFNAADIDVVLLTHGHLDHCGYLPKLVTAGFKGEVWGTAPTLDVAKIILEDSAKIQEEDAQRANAKKFSKHKHAKPLYTLKDVEETLGHFISKPLDKWIEIDSNVSCQFRYNSHIIGATFIELKIGEKMVVFSGDIGRDDDLLMHAAQRPSSADILLVESTYGDREHPKNAIEKLTDIITSSLETHSTVIVPGFAVERIQMLMYLLWKLRRDKKLPAIPIYMDSPMGTNVLELFRRHEEWHKMPAAELNEMAKEIRQIKTVEETLRISSDKNAKIVIAGSGMGTGGRVLTYFQRYLGDSAATILLVGYQAEGTRGRQLLDGVPEVKIYGKYFKVKARIENVEGLSAHADQKGLLDWMRGIKKAPEKVFIVHGEPQAADVFRVKIKDELGWNAEVPALNESVSIDI